MRNIVVALGVVVAVGASLVGGEGCSGKKHGKGEPGQTTGEVIGAGMTGAGAGSGESADDAEGKAPKRQPIVVARLAPLITALGAGGTVPDAIAIELAQSVIDSSDGFREDHDTVVAITPATPGTARRAGMSTVVWTPTQPLAFDTLYTVELKKLKTRDGVVSAPAGAPWRQTFRTPKFAVVGWAPTEVEVAGHRVTMAIRFTGPVLPNLARAALAITVDGRVPANVELLPTASPHVLAIAISDPKLAVGSLVSVAASASLPALTGTKLGTAARFDYHVVDTQVVAVSSATMAEGANGFYIEIACVDQAAQLPPVAPDATAAEDDATADGPSPDDSGDGTADDTGDGSSDRSDGEHRCQLDPDAVSKLTFDPPVKNVYLTSGRGGFRIFGDFPRGGVTLAIAPGARSVDGGTVTDTFAQTVSARARKPQLAFAASGRYLPRSAWGNLGIKHLNVEAVNLFVRHVTAENLVFYLGNDDSEAADDRTSDLVLKQTIPLRADADVHATSWLDLAALVPAQKGVLELALVGIGTRATARLLLTNLSLVAKQTTVADKPWLQTVQVWSLDMDTSAVLDGVEVTLVRKSGKVVAKCITAGTKGCTLDASAPAAGDPDRSAPFALIARKGDDLTYLRYADLKADTGESSTSGLPFASTAATAAYRAAIYPDRGVYRPGDTAHVVAVVRDQADRAPAQALPVEVQIVDPRMKTVKTLALKTNAAGIVAVDPALPAFADTGEWRVIMAVAGNQIASTTLHVEEFVPERMAVTAAARQPDATIGTAVGVAIGARYLFGGSAAGSPVTLTCSVAPDRFAPDHNEDYTYGVEPTGKPVQLAVVDGTLDAQGAATLACPADATTTAFQHTGALTAAVAVLEAGSGRATVGSAHATLHPETYYVGLRTRAVRATGGTPFTVEGVIVDWHGNVMPAATTKVQIELVHLEADYSYGYDDDTGDSRYDRNTHPVPEGKRTVAVAGGKFTFDVTPAEAPAGYLVRVTGGKATTELALDGEDPYDDYGYGGGSYTDVTPRPAKPTKLALELPAAIAVGAPATVTVKAPYTGKILWTLETDHVVASSWQDVTGPTASWTFTLAAFAPNVYVSAFLVKDPHLESKAAFLPDRAFAVESVTVTPTQATQALTLSVPAEVRSNAPLVVSLAAGAVQGPTFATVAVVDEGILSLTGFTTPDPIKQLFRQRALGVATYETIGWTMLHQPAGASSATGGGDDRDADGLLDQDDADPGGSRVQPVKPVALWSGVVALGADGKATIPFQLPTYRGKLRVMAVVASATRVGRAEAEVTVRDPVVIQVTLPRFAAQGDRLEIPVFLTNVSGAPMDVTIDATSANLPVPGLPLPTGTASPLTFTGGHTGSVKLADGASQTILLAATVAVPIGAGTLHVVARGRGAKGAIEVSESVDLPVLPAGPKGRALSKLKLVAGPLDLKASAAALKGWVPTSETSTFWITSNPYGEAFDHLQYLVHYPFGCIEQTTSSARPLLYVADLVEQLDPELGERKLEDMVLAGIDRIFSMETPSGGFGYWPGATVAEDWGTAYAVHFLLDAKAAGYAVPEARLASVIAWLEGRTSIYERGAFPRDRWHSKLYDEQAESYMHYVLAVAGKAKKARILQLLGTIPARATGAQAEDRYLLQAALYRAGDRRYEKELKAPDTSPIAKTRANDWSFYSDRRRRGLMLSTFHDLFGNAPAGDLLATRVAESLASEPSSYYTTQELVWGVTGLGKWVAGLGAHGTADGKLVANGTAIAPRKPAHKSNDRTWSVRRASDYATLTLDVPPQTAGMYLVVASEGVRPGADYAVGGNGMSLTRAYKALDGTPLDLAATPPKLGEVLAIELELANTSGADIENVALVDRLPAGFEIENPSLGRAAPLAWAPVVWTYDYMSFRDDRFEAFGTLPAGAHKTVVYTVRATSAGTFAAPPAELGAMYDPSLWARAKGTAMTIVGPWSTAPK